MAYPSRKIPSGAKCLSPKQTYSKFSRKKSWLWDRLKSDPTFPRPLYLGPRAPVFLEHELDAWLDLQFDLNS
jgi:predicted DNA-binding transcriptional regulator AlpA